jgi:hypothetical protein
MSRTPRTSGHARTSTRIATWVVLDGLVSPTVVSCHRERAAAGARRLVELYQDRQEGRTRTLYVESAEWYQLSKEGLTTAEISARLAGQTIRAVRVQL